jgi:hypothetical protein
MSGVVTVHTTTGCLYQLHHISEKQFGGLLETVLQKTITERNPSLMLIGDITVFTDDGNILKDAIVILNWHHVIAATWRPGEKVTA